MPEQPYPTALRILIVENSADDARTIMHEIRAGGFVPECRRVSRLDELGAALDEPGWDLVLCDYYLPGFDAHEILRQVQLRALDIPVIVVSGSIGEEQAVEVMLAGAHDYINKNNLARLTVAIKREIREMESHRERRKAEEALRYSEQRFSELTHNIDEVFWLLDCREERLVYISPAYERIWERPARELYSDCRCFLDSIHPEDYADIQTLLEERGWLGLNRSYRIQLLDGSTRWINTRSYPVLNDQGEVYRIAGVSLDVTEQKNLRARNQTIVRALEQTADTVMITDREGFIEYVNRAFEDVTGYSRAEVVGKKPNFLKSGMNDANFYEQLWKGLLAGLPFSDIFINRRKNGDIYYESKTITPVRNEAKEITHFVATGKDITNRLRAEERMRKVLHYDAVTGLASRILFTDRLNQAIMHARRLERSVGVLSIAFELTDFIGEGQNKERCNRLLRLVADRLKESVDELDTLAYLGQDRFAVVDVDASGLADIESLARLIIGCFNKPLLDQGYELFLSPRIGISVFPDDGERGDRLLCYAEQARERMQGYHKGYGLYQGHSRP